jgi:uncharacterized phage protein (TIGR01671 family)
MKREILFKARRADGEGWVEGNLLNLSTIGEVGEELSHYKYSTVDPDTVCQYTGLKDKNGVRIFECDSVRSRGYKGDVEWRDDIASFIYYDEDNDEDLSLRDSYTIEIKGNIHDND